jgi:hypothetical protein
MQKQKLGKQPGEISERFHGPGKAEITGLQDHGLQDDGTLPENAEKLKS